LAAAAFAIVLGEGFLKGRSGGAPVGAAIGVGGVVDNGELRRAAPNLMVISGCSFFQRERVETPMLLKSAAALSEQPVRMMTPVMESMICLSKSLGRPPLFFVFAADRRGLRRRVGSGPGGSWDTRGNRADVRFGGGSGGM
jgi:hypothetical protein